MSAKSKDLGGKIRNASYEVREDSKFVDGQRKMITINLGGGQQSKYHDMFVNGLNSFVDAVNKYKDSPTGVKLTFHFGNTEFANGNRGVTGYFFVSTPQERSNVTRRVVEVESTADKIAKLTTESA